MCCPGNVRTLMDMSNAIHLQGVGSYGAVPASSLRAGDVTVWNFGVTEVVLGVEEASPKFVLVELRSQSGATYSRRMTKTRLVAVERAA